MDNEGCQKIVVGWRSGCRHRVGSGCTQLEAHWLLFLFLCRCSRSVATGWDQDLRSQDQFLLDSWGDKSKVISFPPFPLSLAPCHWISLFASCPLTSAGLCHFLQDQQAEIGSSFLNQAHDSQNQNCAALNYCGTWRFSTAATISCTGETNLYTTVATFSTLKWSFALYHRCPALQKRFLLHSDYVPHFCCKDLHCSTEFLHHRNDLVHYSSDNLALKHWFSMPQSRLSTLE